MMDPKSCEHTAPPERESERERESESESERERTTALLRHDVQHARVESRGFVSRVSGFS